MSLAAIAVGLSPVRADGPASTALPSPEPTVLGPGITPSYPGLTAGLIGDWIGPIGHGIGPIGDWGPAAPLRLPPLPEAPGPGHLTSCLEF